MKAREQFKALKQNASEIISEETLLSKIEGSLSRKKPLLVKAGFDPSSADIHLGHTVLLTKLRQFQDFGHRVVFIIGDTTARIGDPSGRSQTRPILSKKTVLSHANTYQKQAFKILDRKKTRVCWNSEWFDRFRLEEVMNLASRVTVRQILERDDFQQRISQARPVSVLELFYPLMQAYDSVRIKADIELGGTDQKFNLLLGRELQREFNQEPQVVMTLPLLVGLDGKQKMSKTFNNHVGVTDEPDEMYGKIMSISDELMIQFYDLLTDERGGEMEERIRSGLLHPKAAKENLARSLTTRFWGRAKAEGAEAEFRKIFGQKEYPSEIPSFELAKGGHKLYKLVLLCHCAASSSEASRLIRQGAVNVDGQSVGDPNALIEVGHNERILKVGKRRFARFRAQRLIE